MRSLESPKVHQKLKLPPLKPYNVSGIHTFHHSRFGFCLRTSDYFGLIVKSAVDGLKDNWCKMMFSFM
jgi:hypothetical protein